MSYDEFEDANDPLIASFFKGNDFIRECKRLGAGVVLLTREKLLGADWAVTRWTV